MIFPVLTLAILTPTLAFRDEWTVTALDAAFPFDGARYEGGAIHDPSIVLFGDTYVMVNTSGRELAPLSTSQDLKTWKEHGPILDPQPEWLQKAIPQHRSVWAPTPIKVGSELRIYYCASARFGSNTSYIGFAVNKTFDPTKPLEGWEDRGMLVQSKADESDFNAIDPEVLIGPDGRHWMTYGSYWSGIFQVELDADSGALKHPGQAHRHVASNSERGNPLEAPVMMYHDGYYYLVVTYGLAAQGIRSTYRMVCGRSKSPEGPFLGFDEKPMTEGGNASLLKSSQPMFGPGGGNFFQDAAGDWWMAYHYYDGRRFWHGELWGAPTLQIRRVVWLDGWPLPGLPAGVSLERANDLSGKWRFQTDFGHVLDLTIQSNGKTTLGDRTGDWKRDGNHLILSWPANDAPGGAWVDTLVIDSSNRYAVGRNQNGIVIRAIQLEDEASR
ncbi:MAG: arabinan endo-1,5-alpha-L-arabinosidase [Fimbriimonadaceae bacterium]|nr:arabinan endo-1,5-alpha-L-arabinosidase [Fimbriimonadaceae bacterium]